MNTELNYNGKSSGLIVITGCDSGIGKSLAIQLYKKGYTVALSYLDKNPFENKPGVYSKKMDLRVPGEVDDFIKFIKELCNTGGKLKAVVANAGVALGGPVENLPMAVYRECFEINYFGAVRIIQALIPELIRNKGKIIVNGSLAGQVALPFLSPYVSTKFALEGFCDSLRREMNPYGIKTILLEPAAVATPIWNKAKLQDISYVEEKYMNSLNAFRDNFIEGGNKGMQAHLAASFIVKILEKKNPKSRYIIAKDRLKSNFLIHVPSFVIDKAVVKMFKMDYGRSPKT